MNYTSIEQSKHLLELGLNPESADACYDVGYNNIKAHIECENFTTYFTNDEYPELKDRYIPCWSSDSLLELGRSIFPFPTDFNLIMCLEHGWYLEFRGYDKNGNHGLIHESYSLNIIDTCYDMIVWLLENHYLQ